MKITVKVPPLLRSGFNGRSEIQAKGSTIGECLQDMINEYPGFEIRLKSTVICLNGEVVQTIYYGRREIKEGDEISLMPRMAGG